MKESSITRLADIPPVLDADGYVAGVARGSYRFMGWDFQDHEPKGTQPGVLILHRAVPNPFPKSAYLSYKCYGESQNREYAAAWLIAHWYEHFTELCTCQPGNEDGRTNFGTAMIETLLYLAQ